MNGIENLSTDDKLLLRVNFSSIEGDTAVELKKICKELIEKEKKDIHLDLSDVKYLDSASIGTILYIIQLLKKEGKKVYIDKSTSEVKQLFQSLLLDQFLVIDG